VGQATVAFALGFKAISAIAITPKSAISDSNFLMIVSPVEIFPLGYDLSARGDQARRILRTIR
jgi:hypothetical protein